MRLPDFASPALLLARECRIAVRGSAFWALTAVCAALASWGATAPGITAATAAYRAGEALVLALGVLAAFVAAASAGRDRRTAAEQIVLSKPRGSDPALAAMRFLALWATLAGIAVLALAAASLVQVVLGHTPWRASPYLQALARMVLPLGAVAALGFCLSTAFHTALASAVAAIYWVVVPLTRSYTPITFDLTLSQHWAAAALLTAFLVALTSTLYARTLRDRGRATRLKWLAAGLLIATGLIAYRMAESGEDALTGPDPVLAAMQSQSVHASERAPGFWLPDERGRLVGLSDFEGQTVVLVFWGPASPVSVKALSEANAAATEFRSKGVRCIAICVDPDAAAMQPFVRDASAMVMLWDRGRHYGEGGYQRDSPLAIIYDVTELPAVYLLDRNRRVRAQMSAELDAEWLKRKLASITEG